MRGSMQVFAWLYAGIYVALCMYLRFLTAPVDTEYKTALDRKNDNLFCQGQSFAIGGVLLPIRYWSSIV